MNRPIALIPILLLCSSWWLWAGTKADSLAGVIADAGHDTVLIKAYNDLCEEIYSSEVDSALQLCSLVVQLTDKYLAGATGALKTFCFRERAQALNNLGAMLDYKGDSKNSIPLYKQSLELSMAINDLKQVARTFNNMGYAYKLLGNVTEALNHYEKSLEIKRQLNDSAGIANTLNNIGIILENNGELDQALMNYRQHLEISARQKNKRNMATALNNIATIYKKQKKYSDALDLYTQCMKLHEETGNKRGIAQVWNNMGNVYSLQDSVEKALEYYRKAYELAEAVREKSFIAIMLNNIGSCYGKLGRYALGESYSLKGLKVAREVKNPEWIRNAAETLKNIYTGWGKHKQALEMYDLYILMRDSMSNEQSRKSAIRQQIRHEYEMKEAEARAAQEKKDLAHRAESEKQKLVIYSVIGGLCLLSGFSFLLFKRFRITQRQKAIIEKQKLIVDEKNKDITDSIRYAKRIQDAILPSEESIRALLPDCFVLYKPKDIVSGDLYWVEQWGNKVFFAAVDCTGHGVPGAFMSIVAHNLLNEALLEQGIDRPALILNAMNKKLSRILKQRPDAKVRDGMDIALCAIDRKTLLLEFAGAYNPVWIVGKESREVLEIQGDKQPVGHFTEGELKLFSHREVQLKPGDCVYVFSDGYADQFGGEDGKKFKSRRLRESLASIAALPLREQKQSLEATFESWKGRLEQIDDVCVMGARF
ncbi:MAG: tetratricopeptide repeat protein [Bacteroidota bacterium]